MTLGERLRKAREDAGLTQKQLEEASGVSQKTISKIERGDQEGSTQIAQLARACGVNTDWLAAETGPMKGNHVAEGRGPYSPLSPAATRLALAWSRLPGEKQKLVQDLVSQLAGEAPAAPRNPKAEAHDLMELTRRPVRKKTSRLRKAAG